MEAFSTLAEVAVGLAGFGSIAIVLAREEGWSGSDLFRISSFLMASLGALFLALLPIGLAQSALSEAAIWRITSGVAGLAGLTLMFVNLRMRARYLDPSLYLGPALTALITVTVTAVVIAQGFNIAATGAAPSATAPFFGVVWLLAYACLVLVRVLFFRPGRNLSEDS